MRKTLVRQAEQVLDFCRDHDFTLATAESCTGGLVAAYLTHIAGASDIVERGFVTYSNDSKVELLGVDARIDGVDHSLDPRPIEPQPQGRPETHRNQDPMMQLQSFHGRALCGRRPSM